MQGSRLKVQSIMWRTVVMRTQNASAKLQPFMTWLKRTFANGIPNTKPSQPAKSSCSASTRTHPKGTEVRWRPQPRQEPSVNMWGPLWEPQWVLSAWHRSCRSHWAHCCWGRSCMCMVLCTSNPASSEFISSSLQPYRVKLLMEKKKTQLNSQLARLPEVPQNI